MRPNTEYIIDISHSPDRKPRGFIKALIKRPGRPAEMVWFANTLESYQRVVDGYIETVTLASDLIIICNEEGRMLGLPHNCNICSMDFFGTIILTGSKGDDFASLKYSPEQLLQFFPELFGERKEETGC